MTGTFSRDDLCDCTYTTNEGGGFYEYRNGRLVQIVVTPEERGYWDFEDDLARRL